MNRKNAAGVLGGMLVGLWAMVAQASTFNVTKFDDTADGACDADCSLREAIIAANANPGADTITLPAGTFVLTRVGSGEDASMTGDLDIAGDLAITGAGLGATVVDANGSVVQDRAFHILSGNVTLSGMTIQNGDAGLADGGGVLNSGYGILALADSVVQTNKASRGGGIYSQGALQVIDVRILDNLATKDGGGIDTEDEASLIRTTLTANQSAGEGGGLASHGSVVSVVNSEVSNNQTEGDGGGIFYSGGGLKLSLMNAAVTGNKANGSGGGVWTDGFSYFQFTTLKGNVADADMDGSGDGGGVCNRHALDVWDTIIAGNRDDSIGHEAPDCSSSKSLGNFLQMLGMDIIQTQEGCEISFGPTHVLNVAPIFAGPQPGDIALKTGSPGIDAVIVEPAVAFDQRGYGRPVDGNGDGVAASDAGAYEYGATAPSSLPHPVCGNGVLEFPFERCDDGNRVSGDGCTRLCNQETPMGGTTGGWGGTGGTTTGGTTGGGIVGGTGGSSGGSGWKMAPWKLPQMKFILPVCGDGKVEGSEQCDDGNTLSGDGCSSVCKVELTIKKPWYRRLEFWR